MTADSDHYPIPVVPPSRSMFFGAAPVGWRWAAGLRSAFAFGIPATVAVALGYPQQALLIVIGGFAVMFGENRPYRVRWRVIGTGGLALLAAAAFASALAHTVFHRLSLGTDGAFAVEVAMLAVVAVLGAYVVDAGRLGPPGSFFVVLAASVAWLLTKAGLSPWTILLCVAIGSASSVLVSMAGALRDPRKPERRAVDAAARAVDKYVDLRDRGVPAAPARHDAGSAVFAAWDAIHDGGLTSGAIVDELITVHRRLTRAPGDIEMSLPLARPTLRYRLRRAFTPGSRAVVIAVRVGVGALVAGGLSIALGLHRPDWTILATVLVLHQGLDRPHGTVRGLHRFAGTIGGLVLFAALHQLAPTSYLLIAVLMALQFLIDLFVARNYGIAVVFITPVALLIGSGGHSSAPIGSTVVDRLFETTIGVIVGLVAMWAVLPRAHRRTFRWTEMRIVAAARHLVALLRSESPHADRALHLRRDLQFELIGAAKAGNDAAHNEPGWTEAHWAQHAALGALGYDLLAECWTVPPGDRLPDVEGWAAKFAR